MRSLFVFIMWCIAFASVPALASDIQVSLDRNPVPQNESFTLSFTAADNPDEEPDFAPLEQDFEVIGKNQNSQFSFNNGHAHHHIEWQLTLMAKKTGDLTIPPIHFGKDLSPAFSVTILPYSHSASSRTQQEEEVFIETEVEPKNPYVQAQTLYTLRIFSRTPLSDAHLMPPVSENALIEKLEGEQRANTSRNGVPYQLTEIRYALFPQKSGTVHIEPTRLEVQLPIGGRSPFGAFFNAPTRTHRVQSEEIDLEVRPVPSEFTGSHWLPATHMTLEDSWATESPHVTSGEAITRTWSMKAEGVTIGLLPKMPLGTSTGPLKQYPDQPSLHEEKGYRGVVSSRQQKTALVASQPGTYTFPPVDIPWWNTTTDHLENIHIPERIITVLPSATTDSPVSGQEHSSTLSTSSEQTGLPSTSTSAAITDGPLSKNGWFWCSLLLSLGWAATLFVLLQYRRKPTPSAAILDTPFSSERTHIKNIQQACYENDPKAARTALERWAMEQHQSNLIEFCRINSELSREIDHLNYVLYGSNERETWQGKELWRVFQSIVRSLKKEPVQEKGKLPPLYPSGSI